MRDEPWALTGMVVWYTDLSSHKGVSLTTRLLPTLLAIVMGSNYFNGRPARPVTVASSRQAARPDRTATRLRMAPQLLQLLILRPTSATTSSAALET